jgi:predicted nucleic acid-binding protein
MHKLFIDVNIVLDIALMREPHFLPAQKLFSRIESNKASGFISALSCAIVYYFIEKEIGHRKAVVYIEDLLKLLHVVEVNKNILEKALSAGLPDFEDSIQAACAAGCGADYVVTRNLRDYKNSPVLPITPAEYLASFV